MGHIFISYSHKDKAYAHKLRGQLLEQGFCVWIDDRIQYGSRWPAEIEKNLRECEAFILLMSPQAYDSEWVQNELNLAKKLNKPIFPLLLTGEEWWHVGTTQFVDVTNGELPDSRFYAHLVEASPRRQVSETVETLQTGEKDKDQPALKITGSEKPGRLNKSFIKSRPVIVSSMIAALIGLIALVFVMLGNVPFWKSGAFVTDDRGVDMALVPAGTFTMGNTAEAAVAECRKVSETCPQHWFSDEEPPHSVTLDAFYMDIYEVTNAHYKACVDAGVCLLPTNTEYYTNSKYANYPVAYVDWNMSKTYCEWRGSRLPTEAEWEYAARGTDGRAYPWGGGVDKTFANYDSDGATEVGKYKKGKSPFGMYDMAGNVYEWVNSLYQPYPYSARDGRENLSSPGNRVLRGGSWAFGAEGIRSTERLGDYAPTYTYGFVGFRCARSAASP